jgi:hypothetical protein
MRVQVFPLFAIAALAALSQVADARDGCDAGSFFDGNGCRPMFYQRDPLPYDETQHHGWDVRAGSLPSGEQGILIEPWNGACPPGFAVDPKIKVCVDRR